MIIPQQYKECEAAARYMTFYPVHSWPHVAVVDPRTGEQMVTWSEVKDAECFIELATAFLTLHPPINSKTEAAKAEGNKDSKEVRF